MAMKRKEDKPSPKLKKIIVETQDKEPKKILTMENFFNKYGELNTLKLLLVKISNLLHYDKKVNLVYRAIQNRSVMYIYLFEYDFMVSLIKPMGITSQKQPEPNNIIDKKVTVRITRISNYGDYASSVLYKDEEIQNYVKKLFFDLIEYYYNRLNSIDKIIDFNLSGDRKGNAIIMTLMSEQVYSTFADDSMINDALEEFNSITEKDIIRNAGRHKVFF